MATIKIKHKNIELEEGLSLGKILEHCRTKNDVQIKDVALSLMVKERDIVDLESDEIYLKKSAFYINGLVRSYGALLKIDDKVIKEKMSTLSFNSPILGKFKLIDVQEGNKYNPGRKYLSYSVLLLLVFCFMAFCSMDSKDNLTTDDIIKRISD
jgi:cytoskeletal protein RodZ